MKQVLTVSLLGSMLMIDPSTGNLVLNNNGTLVVDDDGKIGVNPDSIDIKVVSDAEGNILSVADADSGAFLGKDAIQSIVADLVMADGDGIEYDELAKSLKATITGMAVTDTSSLDLTTSVAENGEVQLQGTVKIATDEGNKLVVKDTGLFIADPSLEVSIADDKLSIVSGDTTKTVNLEEVQDSTGATLGYLLVPNS